MTNDNERIDDLQRNGYRIIQNKDCFCFGMDAVLLSSFAKAQKNEQVLDLGTGNGVIPILMQAKNPDAAGFTGLEIQAVSADLARRSVELNEIGEAVKIVQGDIKEASTIFGGASFNVVRKAVSAAAFLPKVRSILVMPAAPLPYLRTSSWYKIGRAHV